MTTLANHAITVQDTFGDVIPGASVEVRRESDNGLATLYSDRGGTVGIANPVIADSQGGVSFFVVGAAYKITATSGSFTKTLRYVGIGTASEFDFTSGTTGYVVKYTSATAFGPSSVMFDNATGVAIGHAVPAALFSIKGPGASYINAGQLGGSSTLTGFDFASSSRVVGTGTYNLLGGDGSLYLNAATGGSLIFRNNNSNLGVWTSTGLGINMTSPSTLLGLGSSTANTKIAVYDDGTNKYGFGIGSSQFRIHVDSSSSRFSFLSAPAGTEVLSILGAGNIGHGTATPTSFGGTITTFDGLGGSGGYYYLARTSGGVISQYAGNSTGAELGTRTAHPIVFVTNTTEKARFTPGGLFGIGTTSPDNLMHAYSITSADGNDAWGGAAITVEQAAGDIADKRSAVVFKGTGASGQIVLGAMAVGHESAGHNGGYFSFMLRTDSAYATSNEVARFVSAGRLGMGTTLPQQQLHIKAAGATGAIRLEAGSGSVADEFAIEFYDTVVTGKIRSVVSASANADIAFHTYSSGLAETARLTSVGNWKVGGTAARGTTEGTFQVVLFNGTAPAGTLANGVSFYSTSGVAAVKDAAGNAILLDNHLLHDNQNSTLTKGYYETPFSNGTVSSGTLTPDAANGNKQYYTNGGAHTLAPPATASTIEMEITNNGSAGAITTSGFTKVTGDAFDTTNAHKFLCIISKSQTYTLLNVVALQ